MTDIREKVARALCSIEHADCCSPPDEPYRYNPTRYEQLANAALSVITTELLSRLPCGWQCDPQEIADMIRDVTGVRDE